MPDTDLGQVIMKKVIFYYATMIAMIVSVSAFATARHNELAVHDQDCTTHVHMEGKRCSGTVGCSCSGFKPIMNGKVWQQAYCANCGHKRSVHK